MQLNMYADPSDSREAHPVLSRYQPLWQRPGQPYFAAAAGISLYLTQAFLGMHRVADEFFMRMRDGLGEAQAVESPGGMPYLRDFYRTRVAPRQVRDLALRYARMLPYLSWRQRMFGRHPAPDGLRLLEVPLLDLQAWLDGETPEVERFLAVRYALSTLDRQFWRRVQLRQAREGGLIYAYRSERVGRGLEVEDYVGGDWYHCIPEDPKTRAWREFEAGGPVPGGSSRG